MRYESCVTESEFFGSVFCVESQSETDGIFIWERKWIEKRDRRVTNRFGQVEKFSSSCSSNFQLESSFHDIYTGCG